MSEDSINLQLWKCVDCETIIKKYAAPGKCSCGSENLRLLNYAEIAAYSTYQEDTGKIRNDGTLRSSEIINQVSDILLKNNDFKTIFSLKNVETNLYKDGIFEKIGESFIKIQSEKIISVKCTNHIVSEILGKIQRQTAIERDQFEKNPLNLIPLENGTWNLKTKKFEKHNPDNNFTFKHPIVFDKEGVCPKFNKFLEETLYPDDIILMQELFGFCFYRAYLLKKGFIFVGGRDTGKTTVINILMNLIGEKNTSGVSLQRISGTDKFAISFLYKKVLNVYDDLSFKDLNDAGGFKVATGGGYITAEFKFGDSFLFKNYAKQLFATNKIPVIKDIDDEAYYSRWIPFQFDNVPEELNPYLSEELFLESPGIFNWALEGLNRLLENKKFSFNKTPDEIKAIMCRSGDPLYAFASDVLIHEEGAKITKDQMFEIYKIYVQENKLTPLSKEQLGRQLAKYAVFMVAKNYKERIWENVKISSKYAEKEEIKAIFNTFNTSQEIIRDKQNKDNLFLYINSKKALKEGKNNLNNFTDEEIKQSGFSRKELEDSIK